MADAAPAVSQDIPADAPIMQPATTDTGNRFDQYGPATYPGETPAPPPPKKGKAESKKTGLPDQVTDQLFIRDTETGKIPHKFAPGMQPTLEDFGPTPQAAQGAPDETSPSGPPNRFDQYGPGVTDTPIPNFKPVDINNDPGMWNVVQSRAALLGFDVMDYVASGARDAAKAVDKWRGTDNPAAIRNGESVSAAVEQAYKQKFQGGRQKIEGLAPLRNQTLGEQFISASELALSQVAQYTLTPELRVAQLENLPKLANAVAGASKGVVVGIHNGFLTADQVYARTGDRRAAIEAGGAAALSNIIMGAVPASFGGGAVTRTVAGGALGAVTTEAQHDITNAVLPPEMREQRDPMQYVTGAIMGAGFGFAGPHGTPNTHIVEDHGVEAPVITQAQEAAMARARAEGADPLGQVVAGVATNADVGAHFDAAATHGAREQEALDHANALQSHQAAEAQQELPLGEPPPGQRPLPGMEPGGERPPPQQGELPLNEPAQPGQQELLPPEQQSVLARMKAERGPAAAPERTATLPTDQPTRWTGSNGEKYSFIPTESGQGVLVREGQTAEQVAEKQRRPDAIQMEGARQVMSAEAAAGVKARTEAQEPGKETPTPAIPPKETAAPAPAGEAAVKSRMAAEPKTLGERKAALSRWKEGEEPDTRTVRERLQAAQQPPGTVRLYQGKDFRNPNSDFWTQDQGRAEGYGKGQYIDVTPQELAQHFTKSTGGPRDYEFTGTDRSILDRQRPIQQSDADVAQDITKRAGMAHDEAKETVDPILSKLPARIRNLLFHHSSLDADTVDPGVKARILARMALTGRTAPKGVYDPETGTAHVFSDRHQTGDAADLEDTVKHELDHFSNADVLGKTWTRAMNDMADRGGQHVRDWMQDYANQHGLNLQIPNHRASAMDEYAVHLARGKIKSPEAENLWTRIADTVRGWAQKAGFKTRWTDNMIRQFVMRNSQRMLDTRPGWTALNRAAPMQFKDEDPSAAKGPDTMTSRFGLTMQDQLRGGPDAESRSRASLTDRLKGAVTAADEKQILLNLKLRHMDSLPNLVPEADMPAAKEIVRTTSRMYGRAQQIHSETQPTSEEAHRWERKNPEMSGALGRLMTSSTIAHLDPTKGYEPTFEGDNLTPEQQKSEDLNRALHGKLRNTYNNELDDTGRRLYNTVRQDYMNRNAEYLRGVEARINESGATAAAKKNGIEALRRLFEGNRVKGPYFPLPRFGDHYAYARDPNSGEYSYMRTDDLGQRSSWVKRAQSLGYETEIGSKDQSGASTVKRMDPEFVKNVMDATGGNKELQDEIWQHYLRALPEMSMRKGFIHRKNIPGFNDDWLRAYDYNMFHQGNQIARLEYGNRLDTLGGAVTEQAKALANKDPFARNAYWAPRVAEELNNRINWAKNPTGGPLAAKMTKAGYGWFIGFNPATGVRIGTQNAMLAAPLLGSRHGQLRARAELWNATAQWAKYAINDKGLNGFRDSLRGDEADAFNEMRDRGVFMNTQSQALATGGNDRPMGHEWLDAFNRAGSWMFNAWEHKNRETTAMAAYRLARQDGMSHGDAVEHGIDMSNQAHFNYANWNRPAALQNGPMKVIGLFKQYPWQVVDRLTQSFRDGVMRNPDLTPVQRNQQLKAFVGYMGSMSLFAGLGGQPLYHIATALANRYFGDKDHPFDAHQAMREHLNNWIGKTGADAVMDGPMSAVGGAALSRGASYANLIPDMLGLDNWRSDQSLSQNVEGVASKALGAFWGIPLEMLQGADMAMHGNVERGLEHMVPASVQHLMKAARAAREGYKNLRTPQEDVVTPEELGQGWATNLLGAGTVRTKNIVLQALGFQPEVVSRQQEANESANTFNTKLKQRASEILQEYDSAVSTNDDRAATKAMDDLIAFRQANPGVPIRPAASVRSRMKAAARAQHGVEMAPGVAEEYQQMLGNQ